MNKTIIKDYVKETFTNDDADEVTGLIEDLYCDEINYNNADKTSEQEIMSEEEVTKEVMLAIKEIKEQDDRCSSCGSLLSDEDFYGDYETMTNDPQPIQQFIVQGYNCPHCGETERY